ncbi:MAG TPA: glycosyltransferase [Candidatus Acidoferrales bacterium]|nr:glycosyltransferase [Candidatus Acidoferrales bacterium]
MRHWLYRLPHMLITFYVLSGIQLALGVWSLWKGIQWLAMARRHAKSQPPMFAPRVALICPCKGIEPGLESNLSALTSQNYPAYEVFFVTASSDDPSYPTLKRVAERSKTKVHIVVAGAPQNCGEKVNNLRAAVEQLPPEFDVIVFADSDGRPGRQWLARLVAPLADAQIGATTAFRWMLPEKGGAWSALAAAWDSSIVTMLGDHARNFCWGGGTAIRHSTFNEIGVRNYWRGALSDDWALTHALRAAGKPIEFVPECLVPTLRDFDFASLLNFTTRQITITRVYDSAVWRAGAIAHLFYVATLLLGFASIAAATITGDQWISVALLMFLIILLAAIKGLVRWFAAMELLPAWKAELVRFAWAWSFLAPFTSFVYAINFAASAFNRRIRWRGITYELVSSSQTRIISRA